MPRGAHATPSALCERAVTKMFSLAHASRCGIADDRKRNETKGSLHSDARVRKHTVRVVHAARRPSEPRRRPHASERLVVAPQAPRKRQNPARSGSFASSAPALPFLRLPWGGAATVTAALARYAMRPR